MDSVGMRAYLYGCGMGAYLLDGRFKWLKSVDNFDINSISECNSIEPSKHLLAFKTS